MNNGCICCTVRGDLVRILDGLMKRKGKFDAIIVETTGLADPAPVAQTFFVDEDVQKNARLDAVVTVADAKWLSDRLKDAPEARNQIAFADVIVLNKTDLVTTPELAEVEARIRGINPYAKLHRAERCQVALSDVLERGAFDLDRILEIEPEFLEAGDDHDHHDHDHHHGHDGHDHGHSHGGLTHYHDEEMKSLSLRSDKPLDATKFMPWLQNLVASAGQKILRSTGILAYSATDESVVMGGGEGEITRVVVQGGGKFCGESDGTRIVMGGDDGKLVALDANGEVALLATDPKRRWIDNVALHGDGAVAWSAGKTAFLRTAKGEEKSFEAPSTVGGLAFAPKGLRLAVAHYNGVTRWVPNLAAKPGFLGLASSHLAVTFSPDNKFLVTAMPHPALHGWRLRPNRHTPMIG